MTAKHIGLGMCAAGVACIIGACAMESSFDDGSFIVQIMLGGSGTVLIVAGILVAIFA